jgi:2-polyprenyl-3-methyl-5-hydroxy-6-metoxy-1,4-benzoquinol methylase
MNRRLSRADRQAERQREYFASVNAGYMAPARSNYVERQVARLIDFGGLDRDMRILDVGCGLGRYTIPLARRGFRVEGLDLTEELLAKLREHDESKNIRTHCSTLLDHPSELDGAFDAVVGFFVLHHVEDYPAQFEAIRSMLRPGGRVVFLEPNPFNPLYYFQTTFSPNMRWWAEKGIFSMRPNVLFPAMSGAGLVELHRDHFGFLPPFAINLPFGPAVESVLERFPLWRRALPFQLYRGRLAPEL